MQITLINPPVYENDEGIYPPLGLISIATYLTELLYPVKIMDLALDVYAKKRIVDQNFYDVIADELYLSHADVIGISCQNYTLASAINIAKHAKLKCPNVIIFLGGVGTHGIAEKLLSLFTFIDYIVDGESEETTADLIYSIQRNQFDTLFGVYFRVDDIIAFNGKHSPISDLNKLPLPNFDLLGNIEDYFNLFHNGRRAINVELARGCSGGCDFCGCFSFWAGKHRYYSINRVINQLKELKNRYQINHFYLSDDDFMQNKKHVTAFCEELIKADLKVTWDTRARVDELDEKLLKLMQQAGCSEILIGIESADDSVLDSMQKKIKASEQYDAVVKTINSGILPILSLILGYPTETKYSLDSTLQFLIKINLLGKPIVAYFHLLSIVPGTHLYSAEIERLCDANCLQYPISSLKYSDNPIHWEDIDIITKYPSICSTFYHLPSQNSLRLLHCVSQLAPDAIAEFPFTFMLLVYHGYSCTDIIKKYVLNIAQNEQPNPYNIKQFMHYISANIPSDTALSEMFRFEHQIFLMKHNIQNNPITILFHYDIISIQCSLRNSQKMPSRLERCSIHYLFIKTDSGVKVYRQKENIL